MEIDKLFDESVKDLAKSMQYGTVNVVLQVAGGEFTSADFQKLTSYKTPGGNQEAIQIVLALLKSLMDGGKTGMQTFTVAVKDGYANRIIVHDFKRVKVPNKVFKN